MTTNIAECINGVLKGARMLPITALVQLTFYRCVSYFETRRADIRARMAVGDVYTVYAIEKFRRAEAKASGHTVTIFHRIHETFEVSPHDGAGPLDSIVLHGQATHRSSVAWTGVDSKELHCRWREAIFHRTSVLDGRIIPLLQQQASMGECTITLQDIAMLIGLPVDGDVVTGSTCLDWRRVCYSLLGLTLGDTDIDGQRLHLTWLSQSFPTLAPDADEESISVILGLISYSSLRYSWGSACLAGFIDSCVELSY
ncbi:Serine/threonine-protein phosphatase 7 long form-like [Vitis vinifera]|uniref:Serine/threonine-protein phosphatase 7 long form-like n=1 Tax=Vitis vinifera TaxID=29760 RepID=A0A438I968_VITVI|nr:Serine/threonine-protein phosphatase 7 long form-like [Vitis vinifera]